MSSHSQPQSDSLVSSANGHNQDRHYPNLTGVSDHVLYLRGNGHSADLLAWGKEQSITLAGVVEDFENLQNFIGRRQDWVFGYFGYELKNALEKLVSTHPLSIDFPPGYFFVPQNVWKREKDGEWEQIKGSDPLPPVYIPQSSGPEIHLEPCISKDEYLERINKILGHIQHGDVYELNFCQELKAEGASVEPYDRWVRLNELTDAPFASFFQLNDLFQMGASPERFIRKSGAQVISQPIKGTIARGTTEKEDERLKEQLVNTPKERQENIMITDLVRNDLSKHALKGSVKVDELCGLYSFKSVHQLISTVSCLIDKNTPVIDVIKGAFPMGSMTGAPKVKAMELIEKYESMSRGIYSGAIGYFSPSGDFDFNVVIRALMYDANKQVLSAMVGGAITAESDPELEYEETLLKADALQRCLKND